MTRRARIGLAAAMAAVATAAAAGPGTRGSLLCYDSVGNLTQLPLGTSGYVVQSNGTDVTYSATATPSAHASTHNAGGSDALAIDAAAGTGSLRTLGSSSTTACAGNDSRLSNARTPTAHASTHQSGGSDSIALDTLAAPTDTTTLDVSTSKHGLCPKASNNAQQALLGTGAFGGLAGRLKAITRLTGSGTYSTPSGVTLLYVECWGPGGGGGGVSGSSSNAAAAGGGGAGGYCARLISSPSASYAYVVGTGGGGGSAGNNNGSNGSAATTFGSAFLSAGLGNGGSAMAAGTTVATAAGGAGGTSSGGDLNLTGCAGDAGMRDSGTISHSHNGADAYMGVGFGGPGVLNAAGNGAVGNSAGGGGASTQGATNRAGGAGTDGKIVVWEYY